LGRAHETAVVLITDALTTLADDGGKIGGRAGLDAHRPCRETDLLSGA
jgi:hypothetical protein